MYGANVHEIFYLNCKIHGSGFLPYCHAYIVILYKCIKFQKISIIYIWENYMHGYDVNGTLYLNCEIDGPLKRGSGPMAGLIWPHSKDVLTWYFSVPSQSLEKRACSVIMFIMPWCLILEFTPGPWPELRLFIGYHGDGGYIWPCTFS